MLSITTRTILVQLYINKVATTTQLLSKFRMQNNQYGTRRCASWGHDLLSNKRSFGKNSKKSLVKRNLVKIIGKINNGENVFTLTPKGKKIAESLINNK